MASASKDWPSSSSSSTLSEPAPATSDSPCVSPDWPAEPVPPPFRVVEGIAYVRSPSLSGFFMEFGGARDWPMPASLRIGREARGHHRSEEHTSELQSLR